MEVALAAPRLCSIELCGKPHYVRGWCKMHYARWQKNGDPATRFSGGPNRFLDDVASVYDGDDCLIWPFSRNDQGYPQIRRDGRTELVTPILCEREHGPKPSAKHEAAHSCGRGSEGCCNRKHLRWATKEENEFDRIGHGTSNRGSRHGKSKVTEAEVREMRRSGESQRILAERFGIAQSTVSEILSRKRWGWLDDGPPLARRPFDLPVG